MRSTRRKHPTLFYALLACLLAGMLSSCGLFSSQKNDGQALLGAADRFNTDLKWQDYKSAASRIAPSERESFWGKVDQLQGRIRIMDYQVVDVNLDGKEGSGTVILRYRFFSTSNPQLQTKTLHQKWVFSERGEGWQVVENDLEKIMQ
jgi:hypothetical protein